jgi:ATP-dependent DNA helicase DinG
MSVDLGLWAVIDIETTGIDASYDQIIDVGYLQFDGINLVKKYSSLVYSEIELSQFIQKLTGIKPSLLKSAPRWENVSLEISQLEGSNLIAHNAAFESMFLENLFDKNSNTFFIDSMYFLGLLHPGRSSLNLESFIVDYGIALKEDHRGFEDSLVLLKTMLLVTFLSYQDEYKRSYIIHLLDRYMGDNYWFGKFFKQEINDLKFIADQIDFDIENVAHKFIASQNEKTINEDLSPKTSLLIKILLRSVLKVIMS